MFMAKEHIEATDANARAFESYNSEQVQKFLRTAISDLRQHQTSKDITEVLAALTDNVQALKQNGEVNSPTAIASGQDVCNLVDQMYNLTVRLMRENPTVVQLENEKKDLMKYKKLFKKQKMDKEIERSEKNKEINQLQSERNNLHEEVESLKQQL